MSKMKLGQKPVKDLHKSLGSLLPRLLFGLFLASLGGLGVQGQLQAKPAQTASENQKVPAAKGAAKKIDAAKKEGLAKKNSSSKSAAAPRQAKAITKGKAQGKAATVSAPTKLSSKAVASGKRLASVPPKQAKHSKFAKATKRVAVITVARVVEPEKPSLGQAIGLHSVEDPLALRSSVALVADAQTGQVIYEKNGGVVLPIASITKLMTAMVVLDARSDLKAALEVTEDDRDIERNSRSRLPIGAKLTRLELLQLALMASENRAASALGRNHPGGDAVFVKEMNAKAAAIGLSDTHFVESTGLSSANVSTARDLAKMVQASARYPLIRELSTASELTVDVGTRAATFRNTNRLVGAESWGVQLQKTGYISEAGRCMVMLARWSERPIIMVFLDSAGRYSRLGDAQRVREWLDTRPAKQS